MQGMLECFGEAIFAPSSSHSFFIGCPYFWWKIQHHGRKRRTLTPHPQRSCSGFRLRLLPNVQHQRMLCSKLSCTVANDRSSMSACKSSKTLWRSMLSCHGCGIPKSPVRLVKGQVGQWGLHCLKRLQVEISWPNSHILCYSSKHCGVGQPFGCPRKWCRLH